MHHKIITLTLIFASAAFALDSHASILDLLGWQFDEESEVEQRDENAAKRSCECEGPSCKCCVDFKMSFLDLGGPGCVYMKYISQKEGITVNVSYGENLLHSELVNGPNPEPTCMSLLSNIAHICARFSDIHPIDDDGLRGCLQLEPQLFQQAQTQFDIGCFVMGSQGMKLDDTSISTTTPLLISDSENQNETLSESEELNEEELIAVVNETAEQGLVFFGNWLGLFGKPDVNATNSSAETETESNPDTKTKTSV